MGGDSDAEKELLATTDVETDDSDWEYEEDKIVDNNNFSNFYNEEQSSDTNELGFDDDTMDCDYENNRCPVIDHSIPVGNPIPMMVVQESNDNVIDVSSIRSSPIRGQADVRVRGARVRCRVRGGGRPRGLRGSRPGPRVRGGTGRARLPTNDIQTKWKAQSEVPFDPDEEVPDPFPFHENVGIKRRMHENASKLNYFQLYLTDSIIDHIVTENNRFAEKFTQDNAGDADISYTGLWGPVIRNEMKQFIGLALWMGIIYKPSIPLYWSTDYLLL